MSEVSENGTVTLDKEDGGIEFFKLVQVIGRLKIEISTGLAFKQSTLTAVKSYYGLKVGTKKRALEQLELMKDKVKSGELSVWDLKGHGGF